MAVFDVEATSAEEIARLLDAREVTCEEVAGAYLSRMAAHNDALNVFLHVDEERTLAQARAHDNEGRSGIAGVPMAYKDLFCIRDVPTTAGSRVLEGYKPALHGDRRAPLRGRRASSSSARPTWTSSRWARPPRTPPTARRATRGTASACPAARAAARRPRWPPAMAPLVARHRHRRLDPTARGALRRRRPEADLRRASRATASSPSPARSTRSGRSRAPCATARCAAARDRRPRQLRLDLRSSRAEPTRAARARGPARPARRRDLARRHRRRRAGRARELRGRARALRSLGAELVEVSSLPHTPHAPGDLLPDRDRRGVRNLARYDGVRYGLRVPGARRLCEMYDAHARARASAPRSSGASCSAPTRCRRATTTPTTSRRRRSAR